MSTRQRSDIQGLRAIAVLAVIAAHIVGGPSGGFVGVDVFFVISGFLITGLLLREADRTGTISFTRFYERRAKRILPAAILVLAATVVSSFVLLGRTGGRQVTIDAVFSAFFAGNWRFAFEGVDYFAEGTPPSPLQHFWSLGVEEQFYLVWPWVMLAIVALAARRGAASHLRATRIAIIAITICSFGWALYETAWNPAFAYFSTFSRAWELGIGAVLALLPRVSLPSGSRRALAWIGLAGIAVSVIVISSSAATWPAPLGLLPVVSTALVILAGDDAAFRPPWILTNRLATYLGDISYSLYLWHFPIAILLVTLLPAGSPAYLAIALAATFVLSALSYHLVENPARRAAWFRWRGNRIRGLTRAWIPLASSLAVVALVGVAGLSAVSQLRDAPASGPTAQTVAPADPSSTPDEASIDPQTDCWGAGSAIHADACADVELGPLAPDPAELLTDTGGAYQCYNTDDVAADTCTFGSTSPDALRVALVGDSHAAALLPALWPQLEALGWSLDTFLGRGCGLIETAQGDTDCDTARPEINAAVTSGDYDLVLATSSRGYAPEREAQEAILAAIRDAGTTPVVVRDNPLPTEDSIACTTRLGATADSGCGTEAETALRNAHNLADAADQLGLGVVDLTDLYCHDGFCPGIIGGVLVYRDAAGHITATWATTLSAPLTRAILEVAALS